MPRIGREDLGQGHQRREDQSHQRNQESHHLEKHKVQEQYQGVQVGRLSLLSHVR